MPRVQKITRQVLDNIVKNHTNLKKPVIVKLYSNSCHLCHSLKPTYEMISNQFTDHIFYVCNVENEEGLEELYGFSGVPTIMKITRNSKKPLILKDPVKPDPSQWYSSEYIEKFITIG